MISSISIKTKFGWISAFEEKGKIYKVKFGKYKDKSISNNLKKFLKGKSKSIKSDFLIEGNPIQKNMGRIKKY